MTVKTRAEFFKARGVGVQMGGCLNESEKIEILH